MTRFEVLEHYRELEAEARAFIQRVEAPIPNASPSVGPEGQGDTLATCSLPAGGAANDASAAP